MSPKFKTGLLSPLLPPPDQVTGFLMGLKSVAIDPTINGRTRNVWEMYGNMQVILQNVVGWNIGSFWFSVNHSDPPCRSEIV